MPHLWRPSPGTLVALVGSTGWIEIAVVNGDAARHLAAGPGHDGLVHGRRLERIDEPILISLTDIVWTPIR